MAKNFRTWSSPTSQLGNGYGLVQWLPNSPRGCSLDDSSSDHVVHLCTFLCLQAVNPRSTPQYNAAPSSLFSPSLLQVGRPRTIYIQQQPFAAFSLTATLSTLVASHLSNLQTPALDQLPQFTPYWLGSPPLIAASSFCTIFFSLGFLQHFSLSPSPSWLTSQPKPFGPNIALPPPRLTLLPALVFPYREWASEPPYGLPPSHTLVGPNGNLGLILGQMQPPPLN